MVTARSPASSSAACSYIEKIRLRANDACPGAIMMRYLTGIILLAACRPAPHPAAAADSAGFAAMQARGQMVMGVDQYTSQHISEDLPDGGRVVLERPDTTDSAGIATIRTHLRTIAAAFAQGEGSGNGPQV